MVNQQSSSHQPTKPTSLQSSSHQPTKPTSLILELSKLKYFSSFESASGYCLRHRELRQTPARGMPRHVFWPPRSRRGGVWVLCGLHHRRVGYIGFTRAAASECQFPELKKCIFKRGCCTRCGEISCFFNVGQARLSVRVHSCRMWFQFDDIYFS